MSVIAVPSRELWTPRKRLCAPPMAFASAVASMAGGAGTFTPGALPTGTVLAWYKAGIGALKTDISGNGHTLTATGSPAFGATSGRNGGPGVTFDGSTTYLQGTFTLNQPTEVYVSAKFSGSGTTGTIIDGKTVNTMRMYRNTTTVEWSIYSGQNGDSGAYLTGIWNVFSAVFNAGSSFIWANGVTGTSQSPNSGYAYPGGNNPAPKTLLAATPAGLTIGAAGNGADKAAIVVDEVLVCVGPLTNAQRSQINAYFWGAAQTYNTMIFDGNSFLVTEVAQLPFDVLNNFSSFGPICTNNGVSGETTPTMLANAPSVTWPFIAKKGLSKTLIYACEGTNDIYYGATAAQAFANTQAYINAALAFPGVSVLVTPVLSRSGGTTPANFNTTRATYNASLVAAYVTATVPGVALSRWDTDPNMGINGAETNLTYFQNDDTHPNVQGCLTLSGYDVTAITALGFT